MKTFCQVIFSSFIGLFLLHSCATQRGLVDDDLYVVKNPSMPIGESLTDPTSYQAYKYQQDRLNGSTVNQYYDGSIRQRSVHSSNVFRYQSRYNPYLTYNRNAWYPYNNIGGNMLFYPTAYNPYQTYFIGSPYGTPYDIWLYDPHTGYIDTYTSYNYLHYGTLQDPAFYYGASYNTSGTNTHFNGHRGTTPGASNYSNSRAPKSSYIGVSNPSTKPNSTSPDATKNINIRNVTSSSKVVSKEISSSSRNISQSNVRPYGKGNTNSGTTVSGRNNSSQSENTTYTPSQSSGRTIVNSRNTNTTSGSRVNSSSTISGGRNTTISTGSNGRSGGISTGTQSSSGRSGTTSGSSSGGRGGSSGSSGTTGGRR